MEKRTAEELAEEFAERYSFKVPYNGTNDFYDEAAYKHGKNGFLLGYNLASQQTAEWKAEVTDLKTALKDLSEKYIQIGNERNELKAENERLREALRTIEGNLSTIQMNGGNLVNCEPEILKTATEALKEKGKSG